MTFARRRAAFIEHELAPMWQQTAAQVEQRAAELGLPLLAEIPLEDRCLSPSDFGFHNALQSAARLSFIDFEYAGWDDPAKLVCDFFCQPAVPVPQEYWQTVVTVARDGTIGRRVARTTDRAAAACLPTQVVLHSVERLFARR